MELIQNIFLQQMKTPKSLRRASLISSTYSSPWEEKISLNLGQNIKHSVNVLKPMANVFVCKDMKYQVLNINN